MKPLAQLEPSFRFALQETQDETPVTGLDAALPGWQYADSQTIHTPAPPERALEALRDVDLGRSWIMRLMLSLKQPYELLRQESGRHDVGYTFGDLERFGFASLPGEDENELVYGYIGKFWTPGGAPALVDDERFKRFGHPDYAKLAMGFLVEGAPGGGSRIAAEVRVRCLSERARWIFTGYWRMIRPMNGAVRRQLLRAAAADADRGLAH